MMLQKWRLTLAPNSEAQNFQRGILLQSEESGKTSKGPEVKLNIQQAITEGSINWMKFAMHSECWAMEDCSEVLLNYFDRGEMKVDDEKLKNGAMDLSGPGKFSKGSAQKGFWGGPRQQKDKGGVSGWFWVRKGQNLQPHLGFLASATNVRWFGWRAKTVVRVEERLRDFRSFVEVLKEGWWIVTRTGWQEEMEKVTTSSSSSMTIEAILEGVPTSGTRIKVEIILEESLVKQEATEITSATLEGG
jgi:hypothetical protein